jgi:hypothetical protein
MLVHLKIKNSLNAIQKSIGRITGSGKIDFANERIHDRSLSWLGIFTSIKSGGLVSIGHTVIYQSTKILFFSLLHEILETKVNKCTTPTFPFTSLK